MRAVVVITEDVQNVHLLLEYRPHIHVSFTCEHDPKIQEYCVCPQNMSQFDSEGIPNQAPETNKPMILNGPTRRNREGSDQDFDWRNVIFSDEVIVSNSNDSTALVYCMNRHRYDERFVRRIINKSDSVRVACWGGCHRMGQDFWNASTGGLRQKSTNTFWQIGEERRGEERRGRGEERRGENRGEERRGEIEEERRGREREEREREEKRREERRREEKRREEKRREEKRREEKRREEKRREEKRREEKRREEKRREVIEMNKKCSKSPPSTSMQFAALVDNCCVADLSGFGYSFI
ncbi:hypothetical protein ANN_10298 [Periplaneta americana]|uniref:Uncharacterized protein n=1 Tax=Periplaneta americana TaxID=6978 RepID=A0ABQ8TNM2_PERAM|nr:hypothetical protein ANN_10298 [Periplaneta americana]